jgi:putative transposase
LSQRHPQITSPLFGGQARSAILELVLAHLPLGIDARTLDDQLAWDILCYASVKQIAIESACLALAAAPSGNTVRAHLDQALEAKREGMGALEARLNRTLQAQLPDRVRRRLVRCRYEVAIDLVEIPYHGQAQVADQEVRRGAPKGGTTHFHMYGTLAIVHHRQRFTLALTFVWAEERMEAVLARLLAVARTLGVRFKCAYLDKGFCSVAVLRLLRLRRVPYIIPIPARGGEGGIKGLFDAGRGYQTRYTFKRGTKAAYTTSVVIVCKYSRGRYKQPGVRYFAYAIYQLGQVRPQQVFERYRRRFGIESGYRQLHQVRARTASRNPALRLLLVGLALLLVNLWVLLCQTWISLTRYGQRVRIVELTLERVADALLDKIKQQLGVTTVFQIEAVLHGIQLVS